MSAGDEVTIGLRTDGLNVVLREPQDPIRGAARGRAAFADKPRPLAELVAAV